MIGIIGGSGIYSLQGTQEKKVETPYGEVSAHFGKDFIFVPRHGEGHAVPPHRVNYRANIWVMGMGGVEGILAFYAAGIIKKYSPGDLVMLSDFIGFVASATYHDSFAEGIVHADMGEPYSAEFGKSAAKSAKKAGVKLKTGGIIATTTGPRFETRAEVKALGIMGANLVNMTSAYEAPLAAELKIPLCGIAVGTNYACGVGGKKRLSHQEVLECMEGAKGKIKKIADGFVKNAAD